MIICRRIETSSVFYQGERELRNEVLLRPSGIPIYGWEMHDADSFHFVALENKAVVGCVVLYPLQDFPGDVKLMQMAVSDRLQGKSIGRQLVNMVVDFACSNDFRRVVCHSRQDAVGFYRKLGFTVFDEPFTEVGILHRHMQLILCR